MTRNVTTYADRLTDMQAKALEKHLEAYGKPGHRIGGDPIYLSAGVEADGSMHTAVVQEPICDTMKVRPVIAWRTDTSFPFVKIADQRKVPYDLVLAFSNIIEMAEGFAPYDRGKLKWGPVIDWHRTLGDVVVKEIKEAVVAEHKRRLSVQGYVGYASPSEGQCFDAMMDRRFHSLTERISEQRKRSTVDPQQVFISDVNEALRKPIPVLDAYERVSTGGHSPAVLASPARTAGLQDSD